MDMCRHEPHAFQLKKEVLMRSDLLTLCMSESQSRTATAVAKAVLIQRGLSYRTIRANIIVGLQIYVGSVGMKLEVQSLRIDLRASLSQNSMLAQKLEVRLAKLSATKE